MISTLFFLENDIKKDDWLHLSSGKIVSGKGDWTLHTETHTNKRLFSCKLDQMNLEHIDRKGKKDTNENVTDEKFVLVFQSDIQLQLPMGIMDFNVNDLTFILREIKYKPFIVIIYLLT